MSASTMPSETHDLLHFIEGSPSPWHAVANAISRLSAKGFMLLHEREVWALQPQGRYMVARDDASLIAFVLGSDINKGFRIIGAHIDSPGLRVKANGAHDSAGYLRLATEI